MCWYEVLLRVVIIEQRPTKRVGIWLQDTVAFCCPAKMIQVQQKDGSI